jgi:ATP-dependent Clp protease ATP-binding subunit ClpA
VLVAIFSEKQSHAVYLLERQDVTRLDVVNFISHGCPSWRRSGGNPRGFGRRRRREGEGGTALEKLRDQPQPMARTARSIR